MALNEARKETNRRLIDIVSCIIEQWLPSQGQANRLHLDPSWDQETGGCVVKEISSAEAGPTAGMGSSHKTPLGNIYEMQRK